MTKKLILKKAISEFIFYLSSFLGRDSARDGFRVLTYHSITDDFVKDDYDQMTTPKEIFEEEMGFLHEDGYSVVSCEAAVDMLTAAKAMNPKTVCITFDDGFKDNLKNAAGILEKYAFCATLFLTVDYINSNERWLNWGDIKALSKKDGLFSFGSHSLSHRKLSGLSINELEQEIGLSKKILEDELERPVNIFAYPFGSYSSFNTNTIEMLRAKGYKAAFTTITGRNTRKDNPYLMKRTRISWFDNRHEFIKELKGAFDWYRICQRIIKTP